MRLSSLCKSASPLASAIDPRRNSNICNCCSLGRCKDAGASGRSADGVVRRALRNVLPATLSGPHAGATMVTHKGALLLARCHASAAHEGLRASSKGHRPHRKINVTSKPPVGDISVVTLIRTDTTLDHSQKAEKVCPRTPRPSSDKNKAVGANVCMQVRAVGLQPHHACTETSRSSSPAAPVHHFGPQV